MALLDRGSDASQVVPMLGVPFGGDQPGAVIQVGVERTGQDHVSGR